MANNDADYRRVITQLQTTGRIRPEDRDRAASLQREHSRRGREYRRAAGTNTSADSWGF